MAYSPDIEAVFKEYTNASYYNHVLKGHHRDAFFTSAYILSQEYNALDNTFTDKINGHYQYPIGGGQKQKAATHNAYLHLTRYLSAVYNVMESITLSIASAANEDPQRLSIRPSFSPHLSRWDHPTKTGKQPIQGLSDKAIGTFLYLIGIRNVVIHGSLNSFNIDITQNGSYVLITINPRKMDNDSALREYSTSHPSATYSFTDQYFRFEKNGQKVNHPVDYILSDHGQYLFPFVKDFGTKL